MKLDPKTRKELMAQAKAFAHEGFVAAGYPDTSVPIHWHKGKILASTRTTYVEVFPADLVPITGHHGLFRDPCTGSIIYIEPQVEHIINIHRAWVFLSEEQRKCIIFHEVAHVVNHMEGHVTCNHAECFWDVFRRMGVPHKPLDAETHRKLEPHVNLPQDGKAKIKTETKAL